MAKPNFKEVDGLLRARFQSRNIPYETFVMNNGVIHLSITIKSNRFLLSVPYIIDINDQTGIWEVNSTQKSWQEDSLNAAIGKIVTDLRKAEIKIKSI